MATSTVHGDVLTDARQELIEAIKLLEEGTPSAVLNNRVKEKVKFAINCIDAKQGRIPTKG